MRKFNFINDGLKWSFHVTDFQILVQRIDSPVTNKLYFHPSIYSRRNLKGTKTNHFVPWWFLGVPLRFHENFFQNHHFVPLRGYTTICGKFLVRFQKFEKHLNCPVKRFVSKVSHPLSFNKILAKKIYHISRLHS